MTIRNIRRQSITDDHVSHSPISATLIGNTARRALVSGASGRVFAVFRRSFYIEIDHGSLVCLGPHGMGAGPLNVLCDLHDQIDWQSRGLCVGVSMRVAGSVLRVGNEIEISLGDAEDWRPVAPPSDWARCLPVNLAALADMVSARSPTEGLGCIIPNLIRGVGIETRGNALLRAAAPGVMALCDWLDTALAAGAGSRYDLADEVSGLIGLGPGLTPSGDDFLGGAMVALHAFGRLEIAKSLAGWALPRAESGTGAISRAHLACAAEGEGASALHDTMASLATDGAIGLDDALVAIDAIGHCSGWDALTGAVAVGAALAR
jgi:hypothetical protein